MASIALERTDVIVGVDTHKDQHVAVAIDGLGERLGQLFVAATNDGCAQLLSWAGSLGRIHGFGVEGCGSYGIGLARFLRRHGHPPVEVARPPRKGERRASGKSDAIDAEHAARMVLAVTGLANSEAGGSRPCACSRSPETLRSRAKTTAMITLKATLVTASDDLRGELEPLSDFKLITACAALEAGERTGDPDSAMPHVLRALARRWLELHDEIKIHTRELKQITIEAPRSSSTRSGSAPISLPRCSSQPATTPTVCDPSLRSRSSAALPDPGWLGQDERSASPQPRREPTSQRCALPRRDRAHALARIDDRLRRTREGLSKREIIRCLKRYVAREILPTSSQETGTLRAA